jgi:hypothetical protein
MSVINTNIQRIGLNYLIKLSANKAMNPYTWAAPIEWTGYINNDKISFTQISNGGYAEHCFDFSNLKEEYKFLKGDIVELIDKAMKVMD